MSDLDLMLLIEVVEAQRGFHRKKFHKLQEQLTKNGITLSPDTERRFRERDAALTRAHKTLRDMLHD